MEATSPAHLLELMAAQSKEMQQLTKEERKREVVLKKQRVNGSAINKPALWQ